MRNYQILIDEVRSTFASDELVSPDLYRSLAEDYAKACRDMIGRLKACISYLRSGNTTEAVRLAEVEPNLFDLYNLLDFPEREEWTYVLESFGYRLPPPFPKELANQLNDAYCRSASLEPLQKRYRVLALERAPLSERLNVLRSIAAIDPINPSWRKDLETFEEERIKELGNAVDDAVKEGDYIEMRKLHKEISQNWTVPVPPHVRDKLNATLRGIRFQSLNKQLEQLVSQLQQAHTDRDTEKAQHLLDEMREIVGESGMAMPADISDQADAAVRWLKEEKHRRKQLARYEAALRLLKSELRGGTSADELAQMHHSLTMAANDIKQSVPESIEEEYRDALQLRQRTVQQKRHVNIALTAAGIVLALAIGIVAINAWREHQAIVQTVATLQEMLEPETPSSEAETFLNELETQHANLIKHREIATLAAELRQKIKVDHERNTLFEEYFQVAKNSTGNGKTPDVLAYQQALKLAVTENEKNQVDAIKPFFEKHIATVQQQVDGKAETEMTRLTREGMAVQRDQNMTYHDRQDKLRTIVSDLEQLTRTPGLSAALVQRIKRSAINTTQAITNLDTEREQNERLNTLLAAVGNADAYSKALVDYAEAFPDRQESRDFRETASQANVWSMLMHTETFCRSLGAVRSLDIVGENLASRAFDLYQQRYARIKNFASDDFVKYGVPWLETVRRRTTDPLAEQKPFENIKGVLRELSQRELWVVHAAPEEPWYYVLREPNGRGNYPYVTGFFSRSVTRNFDESYFADVPEVNQHNYSLAALRSLDNITYEKWSDTCYSLTRKLFEADGIDPVLKVALLKLMIADCSKCDSVYAERFRATGGLLDEETLTYQDAPNWMDSETIRDNPVHDKCRSIIARITFPTPEEMKTAYARVDAALFEQQNEYRWVGFALRDAENWKLVSKPAQPPGTLYFVRPIDEVTGYACELVECGHIDENGNAVFNAETVIRQGETIFLKIPPAN